MKKSTKRTKLTKKEIAKTLRETAAITADTQKTIQQIQDSFNPQGVAGRAWKPDDGVIMNGKLETDLPFIDIGKSKIGDDDDEICRDGRDDGEIGKFILTEVCGSKRPPTVEGAKQAMRDAGETPGTVPYAVLKDQQLRRERLYAFSKLSFWQKVAFFLWPSKFQK